MITSSLDNNGITTQCFNMSSTTILQLATQHSCSSCDNNYWASVLLTPRSMTVINYYLVGHM